jgi:hypothetical protein
MAVGILLKGNGLRTAAAAEEAVHGAPKDVQGLYNCTAVKDEPAGAGLHTPEALKLV